MWGLGSGSRPGSESGIRLGSGSGLLAGQGLKLELGRVWGSGRGGPQAHLPSRSDLLQNGRAACIPAGCECPGSGNLGYTRPAENRRTSG